MTSNTTRVEIFYSSDCVFKLFYGMFIRVNVHVSFEEYITLGHNNTYLINILSCY